MREVATSEYRNNLFIDIYEGRIPKRVPDTINVHAAAALQLAGYDLKTSQYGINKIEKAAAILNQEYDTDNVIGVGASSATSPHADLFSESKNMVMSEDGTIQHPNHEGMSAEYLDELRDDPIKCIWERIVPNLYPGLAKEYPLNMINLIKTTKCAELYAAKLGAVTKSLAVTYNKTTQRFNSVNSRAPFDFYADRIRSFTGSMTDVRRYPDKVLEIVNNLVPYIIKMSSMKHEGKPVSKLDRITFQFHMPTFLREKDFLKFWWPQFKETGWALHHMGFGMRIFCEHDWTRYFDYLDELPELTEIMLERGELKEIKEKVGKKHIVTGMFPTFVLKVGTKSDVEDKVKEVLDVLAPNGQYIFTLSQNIMSAKDINWDNFKTLINTVHSYGTY